VDFSLDEEQSDLQDLARQILAGELDTPRVKEVEGGEDNFDRALWQKFAEAGLLGVVVPEAHGGLGYGFLEACLVLEQVGLTVAPIPYYATEVLGALPLARFGTPAQQAALLPGVVAGDTILSAGLVEPGADLLAPTTTATRDGNGWRLDGTKDCVPAGPLASHVLIPATSADGVVVGIVSTTGGGVTRERQQTTNEHPEARLVFDGTRLHDADVLGTPADGAQILQWMVERATTGLCAIAAGVCEKALRLTAEYTSQREQFGRPIATFQAVGQRAADAYIDTEAVRLTAYQAMWRLSEELDATAEVAVAKYWAAEGGQRVVHAAQHLHGGMGVDRDYPLHRYYLWAKILELSLGGATPQLAKLGRLLADQPA
jgi:alkylation response protein AidB-like acyl-CoA dehydrogenase